MPLPVHAWAQGEYVSHPPPKGVQGVADRASGVVRNEDEIRGESAKNEVFSRGHVPC